MNVRDLTNKTVVVTGVATGIGRATALAVAQRGAQVMVCDKNAKGLEDTREAIEALGVDVWAQEVDVGSREQMGAFAEEVHRRVDAVDLLINNAGVALGARFLDTTLDDWEWITRINLFGLIHN